MTRNEYRNDPDWSEYCEILQVTVDIALENNYENFLKDWLYEKCGEIEHEQRLERRKARVA